MIADSIPFIYDYPLDYELDSTFLGDYYHDPDVPLDKPTYQYAAVTLDYEMPDIPYRIMSEPYMP